MFIFEKFKKVTVGEVVPAREGLRRAAINSSNVFLPAVGEVVPAREGLRLFGCHFVQNLCAYVGEVVPAREGLRLDSFPFEACQK